MIEWAKSKLASAALAAARSLSQEAPLGPTSAVPYGTAAGSASQLGPREAEIAAIFGGSDNTYAGVRVGESDALAISAVWAAVTIIAESIASLPLETFEEDGAGNLRNISRTSPIGRLLRIAPNPEMSAMDFWESRMGNALVRGNSYAQIERDNVGRIKALWPLMTERMRPERLYSGELRYVYTTDKNTYVLAPRDVLHIHGLSHDGIMGYSPIRQHRELLGLARAVEQFAASWFGNGSRPSGVLEFDATATLSRDNREMIRREWDEMHRGPSNAGRPAILNGGKWNPISVNPDEAQLIESRKQVVRDVARIYRVPPHLLGDLDRATFSNIEEQGQSFVTNTLRPWFVRIEQEVGMKLLSGSCYAKYNAEALQRGNIAARLAAYSTGLQNGIWNVDEVRDMEGMNPLSGGAGQVHRVQVNMQGVDEIPTEPDPVAQALEGQSV